MHLKLQKLILGGAPINLSFTWDNLNIRNISLFRLNSAGATLCITLNQFECITLYSFQYWKIYIRVSSSSEHFSKISAFAIPCWPHLLTNLGAPPADFSNFLISFTLLTMARNSLLWVAPEINLADYINRQT